MNNKKKYIVSVLDKLNSNKAAVGAAVSTGAISVMSVAASAADASSNTFVAPSIADSVTGAMFNQILTQMTDLLPILLPVVVGCLAFRKGISFLKSMIMGA